MKGEFVAIPFLGIYLKEKKVHIHKNVNVQSHFVCNSQKMETTQTSINKCQQLCIPCNRILLKNEKGINIDTCYNMDGSQHHYAK